MTMYDLGNGFKLQVLKEVENNIPDSTLDDIVERVSELINNAIGGRCPQEFFFEDMMCNNN